MRSEGNLLRGESERIPKKTRHVKGDRDVEKVIKMSERVGCGVFFFKKKLHSLLMLANFLSIDENESSCP